MRHVEWEPDEDLKANAFHEAGHAVAGRLLGLGIKYVAAFAEEREFPACEFTDDRPESESDLKAQIVATYAGAIAEMRHRGALDHGGQTDEDIAWGYVVQLVLLRAGSLPEWGALMQLTMRQRQEAQYLASELWDDACDLVEQNWSSIKRVLLTRKAFRRGLRQKDVDLLISA